MAQRKKVEKQEAPEVVEKPMSDFDKKIEGLKVRIDELQLRPEVRAKFHEELDALKGAA